MKKITLLVIYPRGFTNFDYHKWEFEELKRKYNVKIIINVVDPTVNRKVDTLFSRSYRNIIFSRSIKEWLKFFSKFDKKNTIILNQLDSISFKSLVINYFLSKSEIPILINRNPQLSGDEKIPLSTKVLLNYLKTILFNPSYTFFSIKFILIRFLFSFLNFKNMTILNVGKKINKHFYKKNKIIGFHSWDYSRYQKINLKRKNKKLKNKNIIFLDQPGPYFPDDHTLSGKDTMFNYDIKKWYADINSYLDKIEEIYKTKVVVVPHPKVKGVKNIFYKKREIDHSNDAAEKLIPTSKFIITCGMTTAISFAILSNKPIFLTYCEQQLNDLRELADLEYTAKITGAHVINRNDLRRSNLLRSMQTNKTLYNKYKYRYLATQEYEHERNSKLISKFLKGIKGSRK